MATTAITRTFDSGGDTLKWTYSMWLKRGTVSSAAYQYLFIGRQNGTNLQEVYFHTDDTLAWYNYKAGYEGELKTSRIFTDCTAWYHIQLVWDSANGTAGDRMIIYVNGVRETAFSTENYPDASDTSIINTANPHAIGWHVGDSDKAFDGSMSHVQFVNAEALAPTEFGEVDSTSGIWKIKTGAYSTPGTNGFFLKMEDRTNLDLDSSSNAYTFSTTGTGTATYDNPSNNFSTLNALENYYPAATYSNGNNTIVTPASAVYAPSTSTFGMSGGKWYAEFKTSTTMYDNLYGITDRNATANGQELGDGANQWGYYQTSGSVRYNNGYASPSPYGSSFDNTEVLGIALDLDNSKLYFAIDGVWQNSGDPTSGATGTGALSITAVNSTLNGMYFFAVGGWANAASTFHANFGNGYFGTTAVSSANADDAGIGAMEYDVPTGYYCLCTKNIKAYGG